MKYYCLILGIIGQRRKALISQFSYSTDYIPFIHKITDQILMSNKSLSELKQIEGLMSRDLQGCLVMRRRTLRLYFDIGPFRKMLNTTGIHLKQL